MTFKLGLTGSIGMGKSTTAAIFAEEGCEVWDADSAVHRLYQNGGAAVAPIARAFPGTVRENTVDRDALKKTLQADPTGFERLEQIVHPLVAADRQRFLDSAQSEIVVLDIPLLFETGGNTAMDAVVCVSVDADTQRRRVLDRGTMTEEQFEQILSKQMPDAQKRQRSDYVVITDTPEHAREQVQAILTDIKNRL